MTPPGRHRRLGLVSLVLAVNPVAAADQGPDRPTPLPLEVVLSLRGHSPRSPVELSPDGRFVLHTVETPDTMPRDSRLFSTTGVPFAEGDARMEATVTEVASGESTHLGAPDSASWGAAWSPRGDRIAFYSDAGGEAGLWIRDTHTKQVERVPGIVVRPFFGFEKPRWSPDGKLLLVKVIPEGRTIGELNALGPRPAGAISRFPEVGIGQPSVLVRTAGPSGAEVGGRPDETPAFGGWRIGDRLSDLALVDLASGAVSRIARETVPSRYAFSPDGASIAWTVATGLEPNTQQVNYDLFVLDLAGGPLRTLASGIRLNYGIGWSWAPDGRQLAWFPSGQLGQREEERVVVLDPGSGERRGLAHDAPTFAAGGWVPPLWSADGATIYAAGDGALWRVDAASGDADRFSTVDDWQLRAIVSADDRTVWTTGEGRTLWVLGRERLAAAAGLLAVDLVSGEARLALREAKDYSAFNLDASDATGEIAFVATDQQHPRDVWLLDTADDAVRRATRINERLDEYELGSARIIRWRSLDGADLGGTLLLPPGYRDGDRLPLVVWVYGGSRGSSYLHRFGTVSQVPVFNMHVLATRGYAVLFPDAPLRVGSPLRDLMSTVMPGVNAAIEKGFADPDRLAIMGQSYGSYCTLAIIAQTTRFKAAVITAAVVHPDLFADYLGGFTDYTGYYEHGQGAMGGTIWEFPDRYRENSPLFRFDRIETPLLIGQGDTDLDLAAPEAIFRAFERLEIPVEYRLYESEGHVLTRRENVLDFWERRLQFLAEHLDLETDALGRVSPAQPQ